MSSEDEAQQRVRLERETVASAKRSLASAEESRAVAGRVLANLATQHDTTSRIERELAQTEDAVTKGEELSAGCCGLSRRTRRARAATAAASSTSEATLLRRSGAAAASAPPVVPKAPPSAAAKPAASPTDDVLDQLGETLHELRSMSLEIGDAVSASAARLEGVATKAGGLGVRVSAADAAVRKR